MRASSRVTGHQFATLKWIRITHICFRLVLTILFAFGISKRRSHSLCSLAITDLFHPVVSWPTILRYPPLGINASCFGTTLRLSRRPPERIHNTKKGTRQSTREEWNNNQYDNGCIFVFFCRLLAIKRLKGQKLQTRDFVFVLMGTTEQCEIVFLCKLG